MNETDFQALIQSDYSRAELCYLILNCLDIIHQLNKKQEVKNGKTMEIRQ
jgi:hypothetical protein